MADENEAAEEGGDEAATKPPKKPLNKELLLTIGNSVFILAALGTLVYTKMIYKKPQIVEHTELKKKEAEAQSEPEPKNRPLVNFKQMTVNIKTTSGKAHYGTVAFSIECRNAKILSMVEAKKDIFKDTLINELGRRQITELNTIQGKLLLKTALLRRYNELTSPGGVTNIYFSNFILQ